MVTLIFEADRNDSQFQKALNYLKTLGLSFHISENTIEQEVEDEETTAVRERLRLKYVVNGEWAKMEEEDREDAVLLETMLWKREQPDYEVLSEEESMNVLAKLKEGKTMRLIITNKMNKQLSHLPPKLQIQVGDSLEGIVLAQSFTDIPHFKHLRGHKGYYRLRVGEYRIGLRWDGEQFFAEHIDKRGNFYKKYPPY